MNNYQKLILLLHFMYFYSLYHNKSVIANKIIFYFLIMCNLLVFLQLPLPKRQTAAIFCRRLPLIGL